MRVLLVTDDDQFGSRIAEAAAGQGVQLARASTTDDLDTTSVRHEPNVVAVDGRGTLRRSARAAVGFAARHPRIAVVLVADRPALAIGGVRLVDAWRSPERLLGALELARVGLVEPARSED
jgi:hypothetical protein